MPASSQGKELPHALAGRSSLYNTLRLTVPAIDENLQPLSPLQKVWVGETILRCYQ